MLKVWAGLPLRVLSAIGPASAQGPAVAIRPGRSKADLAVELPHPRSDRVKATAAFTDLKARLTEEIRAEAVLAAAAG